MPFYAVDLKNVQTFENLPDGKYAGSIDSVTFKEATDPSKYPQVQVTYLVVDGELTGRRSSEFLSLSPNAAFRLVKWLARFGIGDEFEGFDRDEDDPSIVNDPYLVGVDVIFEVYRDPKLYQGEVQHRTRLVQVLEEGTAISAPAAPAAAPAPPAARAARPATVAAPAPAAEPEADDEDETEEAPAAEPAAPTAPARRQFTRTPVATATGPARRQLK